MDTGTQFPDFDLGGLLLLFCSVDPFTMKSWTQEVQNVCPQDNIRGHRASSLKLLRHSHTPNFLHFVFLVFTSLSVVFCFLCLCFLFWNKIRSKEKM